ncbi:lamin tail domain-containing protein [Amycolatopsis mongoliensis]|uniref:Lamin tail domain-containing protein n=1 Tax=Amycolatopsis mongoliensis TaxID=715475 RepID=A0A9Y2JNT9_9PSEU|nr:lamin tail domain-containing protein [Amycolatopsis sp. 4-36]WIY00861.1 lamin tail domain-containing protein [Amycolatopsis sp. 4-36]
MTRFDALLLALTLGAPPAPAAAPAPQVKIHEVLGGPAGYLDLHNVGAAAADLGGWSLRSCTGGPAPVELALLPVGAEIYADGHFLVAAGGFGGTEVAGLVVPEIPGDGQMLLDQRRVRVDSVAWTSASPCRERDAAVACPGLAESRDAFSRDTDDNRADFSCARSRR